MWSLLGVKSTVTLRRPRWHSPEKTTPLVSAFQLCCLAVKRSWAHQMEDQALSGTWVPFDVFHLCSTVRVRVKQWAHKAGQALDC